VTQFRKKPLVIEARQFDGTQASAAALAEWIGKSAEAENSEILGPANIAWLHIRTLEGVHEATPGDWIIRGVKGEFYPCRDDIFQMTYEPVQP
jgi:hypothetical protein